MSWLYKGQSSQYHQGSVRRVFRFFLNFHHLFRCMKEVIPENFSSIGLTNLILWLFNDLDNFGNFEIRGFSDFWEPVIFSGFYDMPLNPYFINPYHLKFLKKQNPAVLTEPFSHKSHPKIEKKCKNARSGSNFWKISNSSCLLLNNIIHKISNFLWSYGLARILYRKVEYSYPKSQFRHF